MLAAFLMASCSKDRVPRAAQHVEADALAAPVIRSPAPHASGITSATPSAPGTPEMLKLYKRGPDGRLSYHEAWHTDAGVTEHWGLVGERGQTREHPPGKTLDLVLAEAKREGFSKAESERFVIIEYKVNGMGTSKDLEKRHALQERMDDTLGWTGLGHCDGGSIGSGTMEVAVVVVDVDLAKRIIAADLTGTRFQDYTRIYVQEDD